MTLHAITQNSTSTGASKLGRVFVWDISLPLLMKYACIQSTHDLRNDDSIRVTASQKDILHALTKLSSQSDIFLHILPELMQKIFIFVSNPKEGVQLITFPSQIHENSVEVHCSSFESLLHAICDIVYHNKQSLDAMEYCVDEIENSEDKPLPLALTILRVFVGKRRNALYFVIYLFFCHSFLFSMVE